MTAAPDMGISQVFLNMDEYFRVIAGDKIILNDLSLFSLEDNDIFYKNIMTVYNNSEVLSTIPSCDCGATKGKHVINTYCRECGTTVRDIMDKVKPILWFRALKSELKFINPSFWLIVSKIMDERTDYLRWLSDYRYNPPMQIPAWAQGLKEAIGGKRDYNNTVNKFPEILTYMLNNARFKDPDKQHSINILLDIYLKHKDSLFSEYLPIVNKKLFVMENTTKGKFINLTASDVIDTAMTWIKACNEGDTLSYNKLSAVTASTVSKLAELFGNYLNDYVVKKHGIFRKHVYGARSHFTFRCVITSIPGPHAYDEVRVPWGPAVVIYRPHLLNMLVNRHGYTYKNASSLLFRAVKKHVPIIAQLFNDLINEHPEKRLYMIIQRNPSLLPGSAQLVWCDQIKQDVDDKTLSISGLIVKAPNADSSI